MIDKRSNLQQLILIAQLRNTKQQNQGGHLFSKQNISEKVKFPLFWTHVEE